VNLNPWLADWISRGFRGPTTHLIASNRDYMSYGAQDSRPRVSGNSRHSRAPFFFFLQLFPFFPFV